jgi:hypothetical protein
MHVRAACGRITGCPLGQLRAPQLGIRGSGGAAWVAGQRRLVVPEPARPAAAVQHVQYSDVPDLQYEPLQYGRHDRISRPPSPATAPMVAAAKMASAVVSITTFAARSKPSV